MSIVNQFNKLHGKRVYRSTLQKLLEKAKLLKVFEVSDRLEKALQLNKEKSFIIEIENPIQTPGLNAARHKGIAKIGLDCAGRLLPGFIFDGFGNVIPSLNTNPRKNKKRLSSSCTINENPCNDIATEKSTDVKTMLVSQIFIDTKRFQNRDELDQDVVNSIVKNYDKTQFDPIIIWFDKILKKYFILAGHHRFEATKVLKHKSILVKIADYTEAKAIQFAIEESNNNRTMEQPYERAKIYKKLYDSGTTKTGLKLKAKENEFNNATKVLNLSFLAPNGVVIQALKSFKKTPDVQSQELIQTIADWIGNARFNNDKLTNAHETEIFKFLSVKANNQLFKNRAEFLHKISSITGMFFDYSTALNLERFKLKTIGESAYDVEMKELKSKVDTAVLNKQNLLDRIKNPDHTDFIKPNDKDYNSIISALHASIDKYNKEIKFFRNEIIKLSQKKGSYTSAGSNQVGLFGSLKISTEMFEKMTVSELRKFTLDYYNENLKGKKIAIKNVLKSVQFVGNGGKKLHTPMYSAKASVIEYLEDLIKNSTYNNFGKRKETDSKDVLGYLNFKSKVVIDEVKRHIRISVILYKNKETIFKSFDIGNKKKSILPIKEQTICNALDGGKTLSEYKDNKNNSKYPNGLNLVKKNTTVKPKPTEINKNSLAYKMANKPENFEYFIIEDKNFQKLLGQIEIKPNESVFISLTGGEGSMKTRMAFQFMNCFAQNYKVGHASIEEHPESVLYYDKAKEYLNAKAQGNINNPEVKSLADLHKLIQDNDVIVIDSFTKMKEIEKSFEVDKDLRKKYNGKLFIVIFQQTTSGAMRGGSKSQFDADVVLFTEKYDDYTKNYVYATKNRYNAATGLKFNIFNKQLVGNDPGVKKLSFTVN